jgi:hypothetical protein
MELNLGLALAAPRLSSPKSEAAGPVGKGAGVFGGDRMFHFLAWAAKAVCV